MMNFGNLINQVLKGAQTYTNNLKPESSKNGLSEIINSLGGSTAAVSMLSMLLKRRKGLAGIGKLGSLAALGSVAYYAYQQWQKNQADKPSAEAKGLLSAESFNHSDSDEEKVGHLVLRTMIAAAAADGEIDEEERQAIMQESGDDTDAAKWLSKEAENPISIDDIAKEVGDNTALAAEVYLAACLICGEPNNEEVAFFKKLSKALPLDEDLVEQLDKAIAAKFN